MKIACLLVLLVTQICYGSGEFIIHKGQDNSKLSVNSLKEKIGQATKRLFNETNTIINHTGKIQCLLASADLFCAEKNLSTQCSGYKRSMYAQSLESFGKILCHSSQLQSQCSAIIEKLIDNEGPFKRSHKKNLQTSLHVITQAQNSMQTISSAMTKMHADLEKKRSDLKLHDTFFKKIFDHLQSHALILKKISHNLITDHCLGGCL